MLICIIDHYLKSRLRIRVLNCLRDVIRFLSLIITPPASHAGVFRGARISSLPTNGVCGEGRNTSSPKNACVGGYITPIHWLAFLQTLLIYKLKFRPQSLIPPRSSKLSDFIISLPLTLIYQWMVFGMTRVTDVLSVFVYRSNRSFIIPSPVIFDTFAVPGRREFDYQSLWGLGEFDPDA